MIDSFCLVIYQSLHITKWLLPQGAAAAARASSISFDGSISNREATEYEFVILI